MDKKIYVDIDGTILEVVKPMLSMAGLDEYPKEIIGKYNLSGYCMERGLVSEYEELFGDWAWWYGLEWLPEGKLLIDNIQENYPDTQIILLTKPVNTGSCFLGKVLWH